MKKYLLYLLFPLLSLFIFSNINNIKAQEGSEGTNGVCSVGEQRVTLNNEEIKFGASEGHKVEIPSLNRIDKKGSSAYFSKLTLTNSKGVTNKVFCLDSGKKAPNGATYVYESKVDTITWRVLYQLGIEVSEDDLAYVIAQAGFWILTKKSGTQNLFNSKVDKVDNDESENYDYYSEQPLYQVAREIFLNYQYIKNVNGIKTRVDSYNGNIADDNPIISDGADTLTARIYQVMYNEYLSKYKHINGANPSEYLPSFEAEKFGQMRKYFDQIKFNCDNRVNAYTGDLYIWKHIDADNNVGKYQRMVGPLLCGDVSKSCTDKNGNVHDFTGEFNTCTNNGGSLEYCKYTLTEKNCPNTDARYTIEVKGNPAVCSDSSQNVGGYEEIVVPGEGTAIPGKGGEVLKINDNCSLYCLEKAQQVFPGNVIGSLSVGTYVIWPTSSSTLSSKFGNNYPLSFNGQKTCYVVMSDDIPGDNTTLLKKYNKLAAEVNKDYNRTYNNKTYTKADYNNNPACGLELISCEDEEKDLKMKETEYKNAGGDARYNEITDSMLAQEMNECVDAYLEEDAQNKNCSISDYNNCMEKNQQVYCNAAYPCIDNLASERDAQNYCNNNEESELPLQYEKNDLEKKQTEISKARSKLASCTSVTNACKDYIEAVDKLNTFKESMKTCATYTPTCSSDGCSNDIYNFSTNVDLSWDDGDNDGDNVTTIGLTKSESYNSEIENDVDNDKINDIMDKFNGKSIEEIKGIVNNRKITLSANVVYSLPSEELIYNYVVKRNDSFSSVTNIPSNNNYNNYITIGYSNLPISINAKEQKYDLKLSNIRFGQNGRFTATDYICNYSVTKTPSSPCSCPPGTEYAGKNLLDYMEDNNYTCSQAQENGCGNKTEVKRYYCPEPKDSVEITECVNTKTYQGNNEEAAEKDCQAKLCSNISTGLRIIYRTISLENPFPSKTADAVITQTGLSFGMFNDDIKGRYPGTNWNSQKLVQNHILTVTRNDNKIDGSNIYQNEPLYRFELNTATINAIRNYNKTREANGGYADFTLECKLNNSKACVSENFVHNNELSGLVSGVCMNSTSKTTFYSCSGD